MSLEKSRSAPSPSSPAPPPADSAPASQGGEVQGLKVLGTDVLDNVLGTRTLDVAGLTGDTLSKVTTAVDGLTGTLSEVLSTVPGLPALKVPAPKVELLSKDAVTARRRPVRHGQHVGDRPEGHPPGDHAAERARAAGRPDAARPVGAAEGRPARRRRRPGGR